MREGRALRWTARGLALAPAGALFAVLLVFLTFSAPAAALPALTGRVVDAAGMIDGATEAGIAARLEAFEAKSSDQIVVATVPDLGGETIETFANRLFRAWGLGQGGEDNGVLLLVARDDRKMRIEVGYGLEGTLTDLHAKLIIEETMVPAFRAGDFAGGISRAVDDIILVLEGSAAELEARAERNRQAAEDWSVDPLLVIFLVVWGSLFFGGFAIAILLPVFGRKLGPGRYRWLGMDWTVGGSSGSRRRSGGSWSSGAGWSGGGSGWSGGGSGRSSGGFSGGGGSSGGGGASGSW